MDILTYYRKLGAGESSPHGMEREFYSATVSSVMEKRNNNIKPAMSPHIYNPVKLGQ